MTEHEHAWRGYTDSRNQSWQRCSTCGAMPMFTWNQHLFDRVSAEEDETPEQ